MSVSSPFSQWWNNLTVLQTAAVISALILTIGAVIEYWDKLKLLAVLALKWAFGRSTPFDRCVFRRLLLYSVGPILVVLGIAGEVVFEGRTFVVEDKQEEQGRKTIALLQEQTSANERDEAQLRKDAAQFQKDAEAEHLARVKIEAEVAWRQLSDKDKRDIGTAITEFQSLAVASVWFNQSSTEAEMFADDIAEALRSGKIIVQPPGGITDMKSGGKFGAAITPPESGVVIQSTKDDAARKFAALLVAELTRRGFDAVRPDPPFNEGKFPQIWVTVQPRPKGPQGQSKLEAEAEKKQKAKSGTTMK